VQFIVNRAIPLSTLKPCNQRERMRLTIGLLVTMLFHQACIAVESMLFVLPVTVAFRTPLSKRTQTESVRGVYESMDSNSSQPQHSNSQWMQAWPGVTCAS
jgi:hypothetical protein